MAGTATPTCSALFSLEIWGAPISQPAQDPGNSNFIYQRFQRGIMHYTADQGTRGILLADYVKQIMLGTTLPAAATTRTCRPTWRSRRKAAASSISTAQAARAGCADRTSMPDSDLDLRLRARLIAPHSQAHERVELDARPRRRRRPAHAEHDAPHVRGRRLRRDGGAGRRRGARRPASRACRPGHPGRHAARRRRLRGLPSHAPRERRCPS